jgi:hypothetical protein
MMSRRVRSGPAAVSWCSDRLAAAEHTSLTGSRLRWSYRWSAWTTRIGSRDGGGRLPRCSARACGGRARVLGPRRQLRRVAASPAGPCARRGAARRLADALPRRRGGQGAAPSDLRGNLRDVLQGVVEQMRLLDLAQIFRVDTKQHIDVVVFMALSTQ